MVQYDFRFDNQCRTLRTLVGGGIMASVCSREIDHLNVGRMRKLRRQIRRGVEYDTRMRGVACERFYERDGVLICAAIRFSHGEEYADLHVSFFLSWARQFVRIWPMTECRSSMTP